MSLINIGSNSAIETNHVESLSRIVLKNGMGAMTITMVSGAKHKVSKEVFDAVITALQSSSKREMTEAF